jgi:hypothetical protein
MDLVSRSEWGARPYRTPSGATRYSRPRRGVKLHYLGTGYEDRPHSACAPYVRMLQASHMDGNGWSDIGYSFVVCTHGSVFEGRGLDRRNSANGSTSLNEECYAVCLLVGSSGLTEPTDAQLHGARDAIDYCRAEGPAGDWLGGHRDGYATTCPGDAIYAWVKAGAPRPQAPTTTNPEPAPVEEDPGMPTVITESQAGGPELEASTYRLLRMADDTALLQGPCTYTVTAYATVRGEPGTRVTMRFHDLMLSAPGDPSHDLPIDCGVIGPEGVLNAAASRNGLLIAGEQLKVEIRADQDGARVERRVLRALRWDA